MSNKRKSRTTLKSCGGVRRQSGLAGVEVNRQPCHGREAFPIIFWRRNVLRENKVDHLLPELGLLEGDGRIVYHLRESAHEFGFDTQTIFLVLILDRSLVLLDVLLQVREVGFDVHRHTFLLSLCNDPCSSTGGKT